jgi:methylsterol monooxygenase
MAFVNNYSTSFRWWDRIFGTDDKYRDYRKKMKAAKAAGKEKEVNAELLKEVEKEGVRAEQEVIRNAGKTKVQ